jgi:hypothetical protein
MQAIFPSLFSLLLYGPSAPLSLTSSLWLFSFLSVFAGTFSPKMIPAFFRSRSPGPHGSSGEILTEALEQAHAVSIQGLQNNPEVRQPSSGLFRPIAAHQGTFLFHSRKFLCADNFFLI